MPRLLHAKNPVPADASLAVSILGLNPLRAEVLRFLFLNPQGSSSGEIGEALETAHRTVRTHLLQLEEQGIVTVLGTTDRKVGKRILYVIDTEAFDKAANGLLAHIKGAAVE